MNFGTSSVYSMRKVMSPDSIRASNNSVKNAHKKISNYISLGDSINHYIGCKETVMSEIGSNRK